MYEYFLSQFASAEGKKGGQFYTPSRGVRVLVEMLVASVIGALIAMVVERTWRRHKEKEKEKSTQKVKPS